MDEIRITCSGTISLPAFEAALAQRFRLLPTIPGQLVVEDQDTRVYLIFDAEDLGDDRAMRLNYSSVDLVKRVLVMIADDPHFTVDNDCGDVLPGDVFVAKCRAEPDWDWRSEFRAKP